MALAVDRHDPRAFRSQIVQKRSKDLPEGCWVQEPEKADEGVMARQAILKTEKLPEQNPPVLAKLREIHARLSPADRGHQRNHQHVQQPMPLRIPRPRVRNRNPKSPAMMPSHPPKRWNHQNPSSHRQPDISSNAIPLPLPRAIA